MPRNLEDKISLLLDDISTMSKPAAIRRLKSFVEEELSFSKEDQFLDIHDIYEVRSNAVSEMKEMTAQKFGTTSGYHDDAIRTWCYMMATVMWLRSKGLIDFKLFKKEK